MWRLSALLVLLGCTQLTDADLGGAARRSAARALDDRVVVRGATLRPDYGTFRGTDAPFVDELLWESPFVAGRSIAIGVALPEVATLLW